MEVIKQGVHVPLEVAKQIVIIYAGTHGYLDDVDVEKVGDFEEALNDALESHYADILKKIRAEKVLSDELREELKEALVAFKENYEA